LRNWQFIVIGQEGQEGLVVFCLLSGQWGWGAFQLMQPPPSTQKTPLIPKRLDYIFWLYRNLGQVRVTGNFYISSWNFNRRWRRGISFICTKFHDIWIYESKNYGLIYYFFHNWAVQVDQKKSLFLKIKIWNCFSRFMYT